MTEPWFEVTSCIVQWIGLFLMAISMSIISLLIAKEWVWQNMPNQMLWMDWLLTRLLWGRALSTQLWWSGVGLYYSGAIMSAALQANPDADPVFPVFSLAVVFLFTIIAISTLCIVASAIIWLAEQAKALSSLRLLWK